MSGKTAMLPGRTFEMRFADHEGPWKNDGASGGPRNILIGGQPRSGTTLMASIVGAQKEVAMYPGEITPHCDFRYRHLEDNPEGLRLLIRRTVGHTSLRDFSGEIFEQLSQQGPLDVFRVYDFVLNWWAARNAKPSWGFKHPALDREAAAALAVWPDSVFVYMIRDPRDVFVSARSRKWALRTPTRVIMSWNRSVDTALALSGQYGERVVLVQYEDLVRSPERQLQELFPRLGLTFSLDRIRVGTFDGFSGHNSQFSDIEPFTISDKGIGRYKGKVTGVVAAKFAIFAKKNMAVFGYELAPSGIPIHTYMVALITGVAEFGVWWCYDVVFDVVRRLGLQYPFNGVKRAISRVIAGR